MDKLHLIKHIAEMHPQLKTIDAEYTVKVILDALCGTLAKGGRIEIRGFGSFTLNQQPPKQKRNPKTGGKLKEPAKYIPHFKPAKELRTRANKGNGAEPFSSISNSPSNAHKLIATKTRDRLAAHFFRSSDAP